MLGFDLVSIQRSYQTQEDSENGNTDKVSHLPLPEVQFIFQSWQMWLVHSKLR